MLWEQSRLAGLLSAFFLIAFAANPGRVRADALVVTRAMQASTIAEIFIEKGQIRAEIAIGAADLGAFANCLPDQVYESITGRAQPLDQRLVTFFESDWVLRVDGRPQSGVLKEIVPAKRIARDEVTGEPLAVQPEDAELVIRVTLLYSLGEQPRTMSLRAPLEESAAAASIGFVCYHEGLPVNDFRYLSGEVTVDLDWDDPWYSRFRHPNLRRQFDAPLSVYLYIEPYEVRKEIIVRPKDLQGFLDLGLPEGGVIPVDQQEELKKQIAEFLLDRNPVTIDGQPVDGRLDRIHFIRRTLRSTGIIEPPVDLKTVSATLGVIFVYPIDKLPEQVSMNCELFNPKIQAIPAVASDEAGGLPAVVTPEDPVLMWKNYLTNPTGAQMMSVARPPSKRPLSLPLISLFCGAFIVFIFAATWRRWRSGQGIARFAVAALIAATVLGAASLPFARIAIANPFVTPPELSQAEAQDILASLLHNVYRSFDHHDETLIYDRLTKSISGELLAEVYLETRKSMEVKNQGGLRISVKNVVVTDLEPVKDIGNTQTFRCRWRVSGWIGHWGHVHARENEHLAVITIADSDGQWRITAMEMIEEQPVEPSNADARVDRGGAA
jgi:hypothetical protein